MQTDYNLVYTLYTQRNICENDDYTYIALLREGGEGLISAEPKKQRLRLSSSEERASFEGDTQVHTIFSEINRPGSATVHRPPVTCLV